MLRFADITLGRGGAVRCRLCRPKGSDGIRDADSILEEARRVIGEWDGGAGPNIALTGAEPFSHPEITQIISGCIGAGLQRLRLDSDCHALVSPGAVEGVLAQGVRHVRFTLLGSCSQLHDSLCGAEGAFDATMQGVSAFVAASGKAGVPVHVSAVIPVCRHNIVDIPSIVARSAEWGARHVKAHIVDGRLELPSAAPWLSSACDTGVLNTVWVEMDGVPVCHAGGCELHLAWAYDLVAGAKAEVCSLCPLDDACGGAAPNATDAVKAALRPPARADRLAELVRRGRQLPVTARG